MQPFAVLCVILQIVMWAVPSPPPGTTFYVDPAGNDNNDGSANTPWLTLQKAASSVQPGNTVIVKPGSYAGVNLTISGTPAASITWLAQPGAVISKGMTWGGITFGMNASGPSYNIIDGFTIAPAAGEANWFAGIRLGGIFPGAATPNWAKGNIVRNCRVSMRYPRVGDTGKNFDQLAIFASWQDGLQILNSVASGGWDSAIYVSNSSKNYVIRGNTACNSGCNGIHNNGDASSGQPGVNTNAVIEANIVHDTGFGSGGQGISGDGLQNSVIRNNLVYRTYSKGLSLYVTNAAGGSSGNLIINNTIIPGVGSRTGAACRINDGSAKCVVRNNIFVNVGTGTNAVSYDVSENAAQTLVADYNVVMNQAEAGANLEAWRGWGFDKHSIVATAPQLFVNPSASDFSLKADSPAIDVGTMTNAPATDLRGVARPQGRGIDIGAYEFIIAK